MQKLLVAVAALGLMAGSAVAQDDMMADGPSLSFSGKGQLGLIYSGKTTHMVHELDDDGNKIQLEGEAGTDDDGNPVYKMVSVTKDPAKTSFQSEFDVGIGAEGVTDGGLTFGVSAALEFRNGDAGGLNDPDVYVGGEMWRITVGSPDPASELAFSLGDIGYDGLGVDDVAEKFTGSHGVGEVGQARVDLTLGAATLAVSFGQTDGKAYQAAKDGSQTVTIPGRPGTSSQTVTVGQAGTYTNRTAAQVGLAKFMVSFEDKVGEVTRIRTAEIKIADTNVANNGSTEIPTSTVTVAPKTIYVPDTDNPSDLVAVDFPQRTITIPAITVTTDEDGKVTAVTVPDGADADSDPDPLTVGKITVDGDDATSAVTGTLPTVAYYPAGVTVPSETVTVPGDPGTPDQTVDLTGDAVEEMLATKAQTNWAAGVKAELGPVSFGLGLDSEKKLQASIGGNMGGFGGSLFYAMQDVDMMAKDDDGDDITVTHKLKGMGAEFKADVQDGTTINAVYAKAEMIGKDSDGFGVGVTHALGGGASVQAGFAQVDDQDKFSVGVAMKF